MIHALRDWLWARSAALLLGSLALLAFAATLYGRYPGFMARDSGSQLQQAPDSSSGTTTRS